MSLGAAEIGAVLADLAPLVGGVLQRVWAPSPRALVLRLRRSGQNHLLLVSAEPAVTRLHLVEERPRGGPAPFQEGLRAHLEGLRLEALEQAPRGDRVVRLVFDGRHRRTLVAELTGRHGNLFLLDPDGTVLHSAAPNLSRSRQNLRGQPYEPVRGSPPPPGEDRFPPTATTTRSQRMEAWYLAVEAERARSGRRQALLGPLRAAARRHRRTLGKLDAELERAGDPERYLRWGELLKPELHRLRRGMTGVSVRDWYDPDGGEVEVPLDPTLGPQENLERLFKLHRKFRAVPERVAARRAEVEAEVDRVEALVGSIEAAPTLEALEALAPEAAALGLARQTPTEGRGPARRVPYRAFESRSGRPILVGKGARQNHELTFRVARGNDIWLHARDHPGSHVVVPTAGSGETDEVTLLDAAHLAVHYSRARDEPVVDVAWTHRKHLHHPKGAPPGLVTLARERTLTVRMEPKRLERLFARRPDPARP